MATTGKPTFRDLRNRHHFSISEVKTGSELTEREIYYVLMNIPVSKALATRVLERVSQITRLPYTLENVAVLILPEQPLSDRS
jgi:hypothetical protein